MSRESLNGRFAPGHASVARAAELLVERDEREAEGVDRVRVRDDVVAGLEHLQLVARHRRLRQPLEHGRLRRASARTGGGCVGRREPSARFSRDQNSFQVTTSGPPSSNVRFAASGLSTPAAKYAATSSTQIGWIRCVPGPTIGVTGASFAICGTAASAPPLAAEDEARPEDHVLEPRRLHVLLHLPLRAVVGDEILRLLVAPSADISTNRRTPASLAAATQVARPLLHHALELLGLAGDDRDEVDDGVLRPRPRAAGSPHRSSSPSTASWLGSAALAPGLVLEHAHRRDPRRRALHDLRADEPGPAGDEDLHCSKFFQ